MVDDSRWAVAGVVIVVVGAALALTARQGATAGSLEPGRPGRLGRPAVTSLPWRTSGSRSSAGRRAAARRSRRRPGAGSPGRRRGTPAMSSSSRAARAEPLDEPAQLAGRDPPLAQVDEWTGARRSLKNRGRGAGRPEASAGASVRHAWASSADRIAVRRRRMTDPPGAGQLVASAPSSSCLLPERRCGTAGRSAGARRGQGPPSGSPAARPAGADRPARRRRRRGSGGAAAWRRA